MLILCAGCAISLATSVPAIAGSPSGSQQDAHIEILPFEVEVQEGVVLRGSVHKKSEVSSAGTVLLFSPYWGGISYGPTTTLWPEEARFVEAGFAVAQVSIRGTGGSDGCVQYGSKVDRDDAYQVVEALADQPWSNGRVGMWGLSHDAWMQYLAIAADPPALKAAVPMSGIVDLWSWETTNGAPGITTPVWKPFWSLFYDAPDANRQPAIHGPCAEEQLATQRAALDLIATGDRTAFYQERDLRPLLRRAGVPVLVTNGTLALGEGNGMVRTYDRLWRYLDPRKSRFLLGQWGHRYPTHASGQDFLELAIDWFDHYLGDGRRTVRTGIVEFQDDSHTWHTARRWPPPTQQRARLFLSDGRLSGDRTTKDSDVRFQSQPVDPGRQCDGTGSLPNHALYVSKPLRRPAVVAGNFSVELTLTSTLPGGNLAAILYTTYGDGSCADISTYGYEIGRAQLDLRHWKTPGTSRDFPTNRPTVVVLRSDPVMNAFSKGERLVLAIGGGSADLFPDQMQPGLTVSTGRSIAGGLVLPVYEGRIAFQ